MADGEKPAIGLSIGSITNNGGNNTLTGDINNTTDASVNIAGDMNGNISQNFAGGGNEDFFQKLLNAMLDTAEDNGVQLDENESGAIINELNELANGDQDPTPEVLAEAESKWKTLLKKAGPVVAKVALAAVEQLPIAGPVIAMVKTGLQLYSDAQQS